jgi:MFS family permease
MAGAVIALLLLNVPQAGLAASLLFGLVGMAPAGVIMALTGEAMRPEQRAFGMGVFFTVYYAIMLVTPLIAGAIFDATGRASGPIMFGAALFAGVLTATVAFRHLKSVGLTPARRQA